MKLNEHQVRCIKASALSGATLARAFKVSRQTVNQIRLGLTWKLVKHVKQSGNEAQSP